MFAPEFLVPDPPHYESFCQAVEETDRVISVSECTAHQFEDVYGYEGPVEVVRYHNLPFFEEPVSLPEGPPWHIGYMGRLSKIHKNLDKLLQAFKRIEREGLEVKLHLFGGGKDRRELEEITKQLDISDNVLFHGRYDNRTDLPGIVEKCHFFVYTSRFEGGPCFTLLELLQAGRYVVASPVGGIPDIYEGYPEAGELVDPSEPSAIADGLYRTIQKAKASKIKPAQIRKRYLEEFGMETAHESWLQALDLGKSGGETMFSQGKG
jgi:glycosyltransferase involved in cell wall biosynthesis